MICLINRESDTLSTCEENFLDGWDMWDYIGAALIIGVPVLALCCIGCICECYQRSKYGKSCFCANPDPPVRKSKTEPSSQSPVQMMQGTKDLEMVPQLGMDGTNDHSGIFATTNVI